MDIEQVIQNVKQLGPDELKRLGVELGRDLPETGSSEMLTSLVENMGIEARKRAVTETAAKLPEKERKEVAEILGIGSPSEKTRNKLWTIVVWAFAIVMVGAFLFIAVGAFLSKPENPVASGDILLSIFTASVGFFAGLFAPSPGTGG